MWGNDEKNSRVFFRKRIEETVSRANKNKP